jgi:hypothetical protein
VTAVATPVVVTTVGATGVVAIDKSVTLEPDVELVNVTAALVAVPEEKPVKVPE